MGGRLPSYDSYPHPVYGFVGFTGELFVWGAAAGSAIHFVRGLRGSPVGGGTGSRVANAVRAVGRNAPRVAGTFAAYCTAFSAVEAALCLTYDGDDAFRHDALSSLAASAAIWGVHGMRRGGAPAAARCALLGAAGVAACYYLDHAGMAWLVRTKYAHSKRPVPGSSVPLAPDAAAAACWTMAPGDVPASGANSC